MENLTGITVRKARWGEALWLVWVYVVKAFFCWLLRPHLRENTPGNQLSKSHQHRFSSGLIHGTFLLLIEAILPPHPPPSLNMWSGSASSISLSKTFSGHAGTQNANAQFLSDVSLNKRNCNVCIIYVLSVWYANSDHYYFSPHNIWLLSSQWYTVPSDCDMVKGERTPSLLFPISQTSWISFSFYSTKFHTWFFFYVFFPFISLKSKQLNCVTPSSYLFFFFNQALIT